MIAIGEEIRLSQELECGICYDNIMVKEERFGLLSGCNHAFCLTCVRNWRGHADQPKQTVRQCPVCRIETHFIIPSSRMVTNPERKKALIDEYRVRAHSLDLLWTYGYMLTDATRDRSRRETCRPSPAGTSTRESKWRPGSSVPSLCCATTSLTEEFSSLITGARVRSARAASMRTGTRMARSRLARCARLSTRRASTTCCARSASSTTLNSSRRPSRREHCIARAGTRATGLDKRSEEAKRIYCGVLPSLDTL